MVYQQITNNKRKTIAYTTLFLLLIVALGWGIAYYFNEPGILAAAIAIAIIQSLVAYYGSDKIALTVNGARKLTRSENIQLFRIVENLSIADGLPLPQIYLINDSAINAFATGRDPQHASLAVTTGLLDKLDKTELEGVIAHELSHVKNYDIRLMTIIVVLAGTIALISDFFLRWRFWGGDDEEGGSQTRAIGMAIVILLALLAPLASWLIQLAISRRREFLADASAALLTRYPDGLANALRKIAGQETQLRRFNRATSHLYIFSPAGLFSTHPPIKDRLAALEKMSI